ncbi:DUF433 domain-containing protein [Ralstonia chuxiongensis]|uniref:DUF433 domain-containing protein n=1 Tax=Ralstonia chuxiongensis TaxID=2957504 RepID=UPI0028F61969|nr:DUF433 domain-containing protein [Ralstonia chuxiongensis]CAJ0785336.1 hypothetical protein R8510_05375 [Ralstonia chuxiongensis]
MCTTRFISLAEAAFMVGATEHEISRLLADRVLALPLVDDGSAEKLVPLVAPLASFCLATHGDLTPLAQARVIRTLTERVKARQDFELFLGLHEQLGSTDFNWTVAWSCITMDIWPFVAESLERAAQIAQARSVIRSDPKVMGGLPCFSGTRLPVANLLALKRGGLGFAALKAAYPFLIEELVTAAEVYESVSAELDKVTTFEQANPEGKLIRRKVVQTKGTKPND